MGLRPLGRLLERWLLGPLLWRVRRLLRWRPHQGSPQSPFALARRRLQGESSDSYRPSGRATSGDYNDCRYPRANSGTSRNRYGQTGSPLQRASSGSRRHEERSAPLQRASGGSPRHKNCSTWRCGCGATSTGRWHFGRRPAFGPSHGAYRHSCGDVQEGRGVPTAIDANARRRPSVDALWRHINAFSAVFSTAVSQSRRASAYHTLFVAPRELWQHRPFRHEGDSGQGPVDTAGAHADTDRSVGAVQNAHDALGGPVAWKHSVSSFPRAQHEVGAVQGFQHAVSTLSCT